MTQFPFKGHNQQEIEDFPANKQKVITEMQQLDLTKENTELRHKSITDTMIQNNPFVFAMNQAKLKDMQRKNEAEFGPNDGVLRIL